MKKHIFSYPQNQLQIENFALADIADHFGTPLYVYSHAALAENFLAYEKTLEGQPHLICYAVKANSNLAILNALAQFGAGFDIVSRGELERVLAAGGDPQKVVFSGVGKTQREIQHAAQLGIHSFNIESEAELETLIELGIPAKLSIRINPDVDPQTHPYIATGLRESKFGVDLKTAKRLYQRAAKTPHLTISGVDCHIGSQITSLAPFLAALEQMLALINELAKLGIAIKSLNMGGGLGVSYNGETLPSPAEYIRALRRRIAPDLRLIVEPGRSLVAEAGLLLTRVISVKETLEKRFAVVDAAMNDLLRPALYGAEHQILPVTRRVDDLRAYEVVGPVCESSDVLGRARQLEIRARDLLAIMDTGAYGMSMASNYNARPRPAEIMVKDGQVHLIRERESHADLMHGERMLKTGNDLFFR